MFKRLYYRIKNLILIKKKNKYNNCSDIVDSNNKNVKDNDRYNSFSENDNIALGTYKNILDEVLDEKYSKGSEHKNLNIAITGGFGAGKSSLIKTYFNEKKFKNKVMYITLGIYNYKSFSTNAIRKYLIQQIIFHTNVGLIPKSDINRIDKFNCLYFEIIFYLLLSFIIHSFFGFVIYTLILKNLLSIDYVEFINYSYLFDDFLIFLFVIIYVFAYPFTYYFTKHFNFKYFSLQYKNNELKLEKKKDMYLNYNVDELIYFFTNTKFEYVIFEDIDRICQKYKLINELKILNILINNKLKNKDVRFIYEITDEFFDFKEERTKFFDALIPVVPYTASYESEKLIIDKFKNILNVDDILDEIIIASAYIENNREVLDLVNEFKIYKEVNKINNNDIDELKKLFMIILYKVIYPKRFNSLLNNEGDFYNSLEDYKYDDLRINNNNIKKVVTSKYRLNDFEEKLKLYFKDIYSFKHLIVVHNGNVEHNIDDSILRNMINDLNDNRNINDINRFYKRIPKVLLSCESFCREDIYNEVIKNKDFEYLDYIFADIKYTMIYNILSFKEDLFIKSLNYNHFNDFWELICLNLDKDEELEIKILIKTLNLFEHYNLEKMNHFIRYLEIKEHIDNLLEKNVDNNHMKKIEQLNVHYLQKEFSANNINFINMCLNSSKPCFNLYLLHAIFEHFDVSFNDSKILDSVYNNSDYIYLVNYFEKVVSDDKFKVFESQFSSKANVIKFLSNENIKDNGKIELLKEHDFKIKNLSCEKLSIIHYFIECDKILATWDNVLFWYLKINRKILDDKLESFILNIHNQKELIKDGNAVINSINKYWDAISLFNDLIYSKNLLHDDLNNIIDNVNEYILDKIH